jgi:maltoporin
MIAGSDLRGRPGRDADLVAHGSRLDEQNYVELELRRDDAWEKTGATTRVVATLAVAHPIFHYNGEFDAKLAIRNLYLEERGVGSRELSVWVGSRMYRGDDIYLLDFWPLDNLNTMGAGARYDLGERTSAALHVGFNQPSSSFFRQDVDRPASLDRFGASEVAVLDRQRFLGSLKASHIVPMGEKAGLKAVAYAELHELPEGQRESEPAVFETLPSDSGYVIGAQIGAFTGERDTHVNLFVRYARGLAAYGELATPGRLALDKTTSGAHEITVSLGGNWETGPFGVLAGAYVRSFRDASESLSFEDVDEAIFAVRPQLFFGELWGVAVEGSYQLAQRGVVAAPAETPNAAPEGPVTGHLARIGLMPFLSPAGRGSYARPQIRLIYAITLSDAAARSFYPKDDVLGLRDTEHFLGIGAEWWFNSSSYGG